MSDQWHYLREGKTVGPISAGELHRLIERGELTDNDGVWSPGMPAWTRISEVRERIAPQPQADPPNALQFEQFDLGLASKSSPATKLPPKSYPMALWDRAARAAFVGVAVGLAWGIRGDFGHVLGATFPGAVLMLALAYVSGQETLRRSMPALAAASALGIGIGGEMSYGLLHGYAQADTFRNYTYGFFALFLQGGAWGIYGGAFVGMILERGRVKWIDWAGGIGAIIVCGFLFFILVFNVIGFDINPPRSNGALAHIGGAIGLFAWLALRKLPIALRASMLGFVGFGLGMSGGRLIGNVFHNFEPHFTINHWSTMEVSCGAIGGFVFAFGMLGMRFQSRKSAANLAPWDPVFIVYVLALIPLLHRLTRVKDEKVAEWAQNLTAYGSSWSAGNISMALNVAVLLAFVGAGAWAYFQRTDNERWHALPVLCLSFVMLLFQNFRALYFFTPDKPNDVNMHGVFWILFVAMCGYVGYREYLGGHSDECDTEDETNRVPWMPWTGAAIAGLLLITSLGGAVNGKITMMSAATRWPVWVWNEALATEVEPAETSNPAENDR